MTEKPFRIVSNQIVIHNMKGTRKSGYIAHLYSYLTHYYVHDDIDTVQKQLNDIKNEQ